jgi:hypothetical protein
VVVRDEHDDDLTPTVDVRNDVETDDYPSTRDDFEAGEEGDDGSERDDRDDESTADL